MVPRPEALIASDRKLVLPAALTFLVRTVTPVFGYQ
jgi:hypothetical protein